jgi:hypothetical protein
MGVTIHGYADDLIVVSDDVRDEISCFHELKGGNTAYLALSDGSLFRLVRRANGWRFNLEREAKNNDYQITPTSGELYGGSLSELLVTDPDGEKIEWVALTTKVGLR